MNQGNLLVRIITPIIRTMAFLLIISGCNNHENGGVKNEVENSSGSGSTSEVTRLKSESTRLNSGDRSRPNHRGETARRNGLHARRSAPDAMSITGTVTLPGGGPAADTSVALWTFSEDTKTSLPWKRAGETRTNANGNFKMSAPKADAWNVIARKPGFAVTARKLDGNKSNGTLAGNVPNSFPPTNLDLVREVAFAGRIINAAGAPVVGAHVLAGSTGAGITVVDLQAHTDAQGYFKISGMSEGTVNIAVKPKGGPVEFASAVAPNNSVEIKLTDKGPRIDGALVSEDADLSRTTATITLKGNSEIAGLIVNYTTVADPQSRFHFPMVPSQDFAVYVSGDPVRIVPVTESFRSGTPVVHLDVTDGESTVTEIKVTAGKTMRGQVLDSATSDPLSGVRIYPDNDALEDNRNFAETTATGDFVLPGVYRPNSVQIKSDSHYLVSPVGRNGVFEGDPAGSVTIVMARSPFIRGTVEAAVGGAVAGATLTMFEGERVTEDGMALTIGAGGAFHGKATPGKTYTLMAEAPRYAAAVSDPITVTPDGVAGINLRLGHGRRVSGIVLDSSGKPVEGADVKVTIPDTFDRTFFFATSRNTNTDKIYSAAHTDAAGKFQLTLLPTTADLLIAAEASGFAHPAYYSLKKSEADVSDIRLQLPETTQLRGRIINEKAEPVAGAEINVSAMASQLYFYTESVSSTSGTFHTKAFPRSQIATFRIERKGYLDYKDNLHLTDEPLSITLTKANGVDIFVHCLEIETREPVEATVTARNMSDFEIHPKVGPVDGEPGLFRVEEIEMGTRYMIYAQADGYTADYFFDVINEANKDNIELLMRHSGSIRGRVIDATDRKPVSGAEITREHSDKVAATTDVEGQFEFVLDSSARSYIASDNQDRVSLPFDPFAPAGDVVDIGNIELFSRVPLTIRVVRGRSGDPVRDAQVEVTIRQPIGGSKKLTGKTDQRGEFITSAFPSSKVTVKLPEWNITKDAESHSSSEKEWVIICNAGGGEFRGRILLEDEPVAGRVIGVHLDTQKTGVLFKTGSDGEFEFENLAPGRWEFSASNQSSNISAGDFEMVIKPDDDPVEHDFHLASNHLSGMVVDETGQPAAGANVDLRKADRESNYGTTSDADGRFEFSTPIAPGPYRIQATHETKGRTDFLPFEMPETGDPPALTLTLKATPVQITCTVLSILDGLPIQGASAKLMSGSEIVASKYNSTGEQDVVISDVRPGQYQLVVTASGYSEVTRSITVESGESPAYTDVLSPAANLTVQVFDANGYIITGAVVTVSPGDSNTIASPRSATTDDTGTAEFNGMLYGIYQVQTTTPTGATGMGNVSTRNQQNTSFRMVVR